MTFIGKMDKCGICSVETTNGVCERCLATIHKYQDDVVDGRYAKEPFQDHIVGVVEVDYDELGADGSAVRSASMKLPVYDFMHTGANDDWSPDSKDPMWREEELVFTWETSDEKSLEEIISLVYRGNKSGITCHGIEYNFKEFVYSFKVLGSRKSKEKMLDQVRAKRLLDLYPMDLFPDPHSRKF